MDVKFIELNYAFIWFKLPNLNFKYWSLIRMNKIGSLIHKLLIADQNVENKQRLNFVKILVEVELSINFFELVYLKNVKSKVIK